MLHVLQAEMTFMMIVELVLLVVKIFAFVNSLMWVAVQLVLGGSLLLISLAFTIAALVYLADVRPALASLTRR
ncbi:MAG: DUF2516 family protein [Nocardioides sp.]|nr:DUF2516 family protein [Nocardioides sp.]